MKAINSLYISLIITFFAIIPTNAQNSVKSGSFQFINSDNRVGGSVILQSSTQKFKFPISEDVVIAYLLPGRYSFIIELQSSDIGAKTTKYQQNIDIESNRRTVCRMGANSTLTFRKEWDRNSIAIFLNDNRGNHKAISDVDFNRLCNAIRSNKYSNAKMQTLKTKSSSYPAFTSEQVKSLALLFSFDNDRLECAKHLTSKVLDTQNLPYIKDIFIFDSTKAAYWDFLNRRRRSVSSSPFR